MTMQMRDAMHFEGENWALWGDSGGGFFDPSEHGLNVEGWYSTACYRGYHATYHIYNGFLRLLNLEISLDENAAPVLNGCVPQKKPEEVFSICGNLTYRDVSLPVPFSGGLLLCRERVEKRPSSIGPELAWIFKQVKELVFDKGKLIHSQDHSAAVARIREEVAANNGEITITVGVCEDEGDIYARYKSLQARINSCFQFDY